MLGISLHFWPFVVFYGRSAIKITNLSSFKLCFMPFISFNLDAGFRRWQKKEKILSTFLGLQKIKVDRGATKNDKVVIMLWPTNKKCTILFCVWLVLLGQHGWHTIFWLWKQRALKHRSNVSTTPITAMGCQQHLPLSVVQLKGKHWWKPYCGNGVVHMFKHLATARQNETVYV